MSLFGQNPQDQTLLDSLLLQISQGNLAALELFYQQTKASIYAYAFSLLKNGEDAKDAMQDTYLQVVANAKKYQPQGKPMGWVLTITRNICLMKLRKDKHSSENSWEDLCANLPQAESLPIEDQWLLQSLLDALSEEERQIVLLHTVSGFKHREISRFLGISLSSVLSKYHRAIKKLRNSIAGGEEKNQ